MTAHRLISMEFFRNCLLFSLFLLPVPFILLVMGAPYWGYILWALFVGMAARIETLRNDLTGAMIEKNSFEFRLKQSEGVLLFQRAEAEKSKAGLLTWISALEKLSEEQRAEIQRLRRIGESSSLPKLDAGEIVSFGNDQPLELMAGVDRAA
jgi:hypothetical protein